MFVKRHTRNLGKMVVWHWSLGDYRGLQGNRLGIARCISIQPETDPVRRKTFSSSYSVARTLKYRWRFVGLCDVVLRVVWWEVVTRPHPSDELMRSWRYPH